MSGSVKNKRHRLRPILEPMIAEPKPPNIAPSPNIPPEKKHDKVKSKALIWFTDGS